MKINDYVALSTIFAIGEDGYDKFRQYLQFLGYAVNQNVAKWCNLLPFLHDSPCWAIILSKNGDLALVRNFCLSGKEVSLDQVKRMIELAL